MKLKLPLLNTVNIQPPIINSIHAPNIDLLAIIISVKDYVLQMKRNDLKLNETTS